MEIEHKRTSWWEKNIESKLRFRSFIMKKVDFENLCNMQSLKIENYMNGKRLLVILIHFVLFNDFTEGSIYTLYLLK